jgi:cytochrome P450
MIIELDRPRSPSVFEAGLPSIDYQLEDDPEQAHAIIRQAREQAPIAVGPFGPELLTYDLVHAVLRDPRFHVPPGFLLAAQGVTSGPLWDRVIASILSLDGAEHHRLRRLVSKAFAPRAAARLRSTITAVINDLVEPLTATGSCDVVTDIARQYPIPIICALLGTDRGDWKLFSDWTDDIMKAFSWTAAEDEPIILRSWQALDAYIDDMIAVRRDDLTDDLLSDLIRAEDDGDRLTHSELLMLASGLLMAGTDTTRNQVAAAVYALCDHSDQWALLAEHPELAPNAVEEALRHSPIAAATFRSADVDVELGGVTIPAGTFVVVNAASANRDPAVFEDPDRLDITRESPANMLTFGGGVHYCLGSHLARAELVEALTVMSRRMPNPRRTGPAPWKPLTGLSGPITLPIEFDPGH